MLKTLIKKLNTVHPKKAHYLIIKKKLASTQNVSTKIDMWYLPRLVAAHDHHQLCGVIVIIFEFEDSKEH